MSPSKMRISPLLVGWMMLLLAGAALADPPGRVGRLADLQGQVWMWSPESGDWKEAQRNRPLTTGDRVSTEREARAELRIGSAAVRLDGATELEVLQIDDSAIRVQLHNGTLAARLRSGDVAREFELLTTEGRFKPQRAGRYRFDHSDETSRATAWSGQVLFEGQDNAVTISTGQRAEVWRDGRTQYSLTEPVRDGFSDWVASRDEADERSASARYVSPEMTGIEELDRDGRWETSSEYGPLWTPYHVAPGWAPYRYGHWAWVHPWGWTWVDDARWGFAPSHYGRWVYHRSVWCWSPGHYVARPIYSPALVAWVGGPRVSVSINIGPTVGWFPLAPREIYVPAYKASPRYLRSINATHVANFDAARPVQQTTYAHRGLAHAVTVVPAEVVTNRLPVRNAAVQHGDARLVRELAREPVSVQAPVAAPVLVRRVDAGSSLPRERAPGLPPAVSRAPATGAAPVSPVTGDASRVRPAASHTMPAAPARVVPVRPVAAPTAPSLVAPPAAPRAADPVPVREHRERDVRVVQPMSPPERRAITSPPERRAITPAPAPHAGAPQPMLQQPNPTPARVIRVHPQAEPAPAMRALPPAAVREQQQPRLVSPERGRGGGEHRPMVRERML